MRGRSRLNFSEGSGVHGPSRQSLPATRAHRHAVLRQPSLLAFSFQVRSVAQTASDRCRHGHDDAHGRLVAEAEDVILTHMSKMSASGISSNRVRNRRGAASLLAVVAQLRSGACKGRVAGCGPVDLPERRAGPADPHLRAVLVDLTINVADGRERIVCHSESKLPVADLKQVDREPHLG